MDDTTRKRLDDLIGYLKRESRLPLANRFLSEETAEVIAKSWFNKSWSDMMHDELAEEGDRLHYHRTLNKACKHDVPKLVAFMEKNVYAPTILDLVELKKRELEEFDDPDPLYLLEMALGLAEMEQLSPTHVHMLKLISFHQDEYGSLDQLRGKESPRDMIRRTLDTNHVVEIEPNKGATPDFENLEPDKTSIDRINQAVMEMWTRFEKRLSVKVTRLLHDSRNMKLVKAELWQRQETAEALLLDSENNCDDDILNDQFETDLESKLPAFRREMGKKIAANPRMAEKIYDVLDTLATNEISAFEYLDIALDLSKSTREALIDVIRLDLLAEGKKYRSHMAIRDALDNA